MDYDFETIKFELHDDGIGILSLNRPDNLNAMSLQLVEDLHQILDHLMINLDCRVLILRAEGRVFCAGLDLKETPLIWKKKLPEEYKKFSHIDVSEVVKRQMYIQYRISNAIKKMRKIPQPIIAIIQGAATGGGFALTLAADIRIASYEAKFNNAFIKIGLSGSDVGTSYFLPRLIGMSRATEILYTGRFFDSREAEKIGFLLETVEKDKLLERALKLAREFLTKSPLGLRMTKEAINLSMDAPSLETLTELENRAQIICGTSKDAVEGGQAFWGKRDPKYPMR